MIELKPKEKAVFDFLVAYLADAQYPPSYREICSAVGIPSTATVYGLLKKLEEKGYIESTSQKNRSITIVGNKSNTKTQFIPEVGVVAAGIPITAVENIESYHPVSEGFFEGENHFILNVRGDSMINAGIYNNDKIIVSQTCVAQNGDIVVALIEDEATVKRYFKEKNTIRLQPENDTMEPIFAKNVVVLGKVVGLMRRL